MFRGLEECRFHVPTLGGGGFALRSRSQATLRALLSTPRLRDLRGSGDCGRILDGNPENRLRTDATTRGGKSFNVPAIRHLFSARGLISASGSDECRGDYCYQRLVESCLYNYATRIPRIGDSFVPRARCNYSTAGRTWNPVSRRRLWPRLIATDFSQMDLFLKAVSHSHICTSYFNYAVPNA